MAMRQQMTAGRIVRNARVLGGEPIVRGTRLSVRSIVLAAREHGGSEGVVEAYPQLSPDDVDAALAFYDAHVADVERYIQANLADD